MNLRPLPLAILLTTSCNGTVQLGTTSGTSPTEDASTHVDAAKAQDAGVNKPADSGMTTRVDAGSSKPTCVPGQSISCAGAGGCISSQVCNAAGTGYGDCDCGADGGPHLLCIPGQSIACSGPYGCPSYQVCDDAGSAYGPCDCPDGAAVATDAGELPDGYAPIPATIGNQGYSAIWAVNPDWSPSQGWIFRPLFSAPDCSVVPPYGEAYAAIFTPTSAGPSGTYPVCAIGSQGPTPCYETQLYDSTGQSSFEAVPDGILVLSDFNGDGIATGQMDTAEGIVPLIVKKCP
jgi:hypothetical protein